uniref:Uncharacterized protein n=1 Tax=Oryza brachyantha TaxID=4533 RepID=J3KVI1_ORYBR
MESQEREEGDEQLKEKKKKERLLDFLRAAPFKAAPPWFLTRLASLRATKPAASRRLPAFARSVDLRALRAKCVAWARHPMNAALLVWLAFVAGGVAFVLLLMTGALNSAVPDASRRRRWTEVANQMRRRFGLPADLWTMCGGRATAADYGKWLCCAPCALAQEVRTANLYDVEENVLYVRDVKGGNGKEEEEVSPKPAAMAPLEREGCVVAVDAPPLPIRIEGNDEYCCGGGLLVDIEN